MAAILLFPEVGLRPLEFLVFRPLLLLNLVMRHRLLCKILPCLFLYVLAGCQLSPTSTQTSAPQSTAKSLSENLSAHNYRPRKAIPLVSLDRTGVPTEGQCAGLPRAAVEAQDRSIDCIGVIDSQLAFPRGVVGWNGDILVVDKKASLHRRNLGRKAGRIYRYVKTDAGYQRRLLVEGLDNPSSLSRGQHPADKHLVYVSTPDAILRFAPDADDVVGSRERVVVDLPLTGWHYLSAAYATDNYLYVTVPSASDHCEEYLSPTLVVDARYPCPEVDPPSGANVSAERVTASIRRYEIDAKGQISKDFVLVARGLRDALALVQVQGQGQVPGSDRLLAADNGWDDIDLAQTGLNPATVPHDEINLVAPGEHPAHQTSRHYGWPYCYDDGILTPGYENFTLACDKYSDPLLLLPAHSAPLAMLIHNKQLLVNLHGFEVGGRRTLAFELNEQGLPVGPGDVFIDWNFNDQFGYLWGRPFGLSKLGPSELLVTDDWNHSLLLVVLRTKDQKAAPR